MVILARHVLPPHAPHLPAPVVSGESCVLGPVTTVVSDSQHFPPGIIFEPPKHASNGDLEISFRRSSQKKKKKIHFLGCLRSKWHP